MLRTITCTNWNIEIETNKDIMNIEVSYFSILWNYIKYSRHIEEWDRELTLYPTDKLYVHTKLIPFNK
jgi:hypothetical protein